MSAGPLVLEPAGAGADRASRERVDVWVVDLTTRGHQVAPATLSGPERAFAARLRVGAGAWVAARSALRRVLGSQLGVAPGQVALESGANGKPRLSPGTAADLRFSLSHSGNVALVAVRLASEVGIDVEEVRPGVDGDAIAREVFTARERVSLASPGGAEPCDPFFRAWVRHEALAKATGRGIVNPSSPGDGARFTVRDLDFVAGFAAALASEGAGWIVRLAGRA